MMTRHRVWLDDQPMHDLDPTIYITDVMEQTPQIDVLAFGRAIGDGQHVSRRTRQMLTVSVKFAIREYDTARRKSVMQKIHLWTMGKTWLTISDRPGQRLRVSVDNLPTITSAGKWTETLSLTFTAYESPYWESTRLHMVHTDGSAAMLVPGTAPSAKVDVSITTGGEGNTSTITVLCDPYVIALTGMALAPGSAVIFRHDEQGVLHIEADGVSILHHRVPESADDLLITPGKATALSCTADQPLTATFSCREVWA